MRVRGALACFLVAALSAAGAAQEMPRPGPPRLDEFEVDADADGVPDGWYNLRDATVVARGGPSGPKYLQFANAKLGRQARASRAFGVDGRKTEALIVGAWVRVLGIQTGERLGEDASLQIDFLGDGLIPTGRGVVGPWNAALGDGWVHVAKRIPIAPGTRDAILTLGLLGAVGTLEVDGLAIEEVPVGGAATTNLLLNGDFELGAASAPFWSLEDGAKRASPGPKSPTMLELSGSGAKALNGLSVRAERFPDLEVRLSAKGSGLRGAGGARASMYFLDADGKPLTGPDEGTRIFRWAGTFDWKAEQASVRVPSSASRAVLQVEVEGSGTLRVDDVEVTAPGEAGGKWTPYHVETETEGWRPLEPSPGIVAGSALDASAVRGAPTTATTALTIKEGHLRLGSGPRARLFGVVILPPLTFPDPPVADALADRLSRSGVNLVRFDALDAPLGAGQSLYDDGRDDTKALDPDAIAKFDHLVAALKAKGIYVTLELQSARRFRPGDGLPATPLLPPGGGPSAATDPLFRPLAIAGAESLLGHVNPETKLALRDDPVLAYVSLAGEVSAFDRIDATAPPPAEWESRFKDQVRRPNVGAGRRGWQALESAQWKAIADALRQFGLKRPIAGSSHWRRELEFVAAQAASGLDLIDDRLYWSPPRYGAPERRSMVWKPGSGLSTESARKRKGDRPYVVSSWCSHTEGAWALPFEGADLMFVARTAALEDWDGLARRGVFAYPREWGAASPGTTGRQDLFVLPEALNANPQVFALLPHAASLYLRAEKPRRTSASSWDPAHGRLVIDTPHTQGIAGAAGKRPTTLEAVTIESGNAYAVVMVSSLGPPTIAQAKSVLVTAVARAEPTGLSYADPWKREIGSPGRAPILVEPVRGRVTWKKKGAIKAYALKPDGSRGAPARVTTSAEGTTLEIDGDSATLHWELTE